MKGPGAVAAEPSDGSHIFEGTVNEGDTLDWKWSIPFLLSRDQLNLLLPDWKPTPIFLQIAIFLRTATARTN